jgi:hypothetical protein
MVGGRDVTHLAVVFEPVEVDRRSRNYSNVDVDGGQRHTHHRDAMRRIR